ncbi:hypothetical protein BJF79_21075 [Actinomadura sp. CNU-125]|nr:hypothetical protein BJF79_21075 [Actinomadura sp. CNU-125]
MMAPLRLWPVAFQTAARTRRPPSRGRPGRRLKTPTRRLAKVRASMRRRAVGGRGRVAWARRPSPARTRLTRGPAKAMRNSRPGVGASRSMEVSPPRMWRVTERTGSPRTRAVTAWLSSWTKTEP